MSVHRNNKAVASIFRGEQPIGRAYRGDRLVFQKGGGALDFLNFTAVEDGSSVKYTKSTYESAEYSYDKVTWANASSVVISLNSGQKVYFRGVIQSSKTTSKTAIFTMTGKIAAGGSIQSMRNGDPLDDLVTTNCYYNMFNGCTSLVKVAELPATTLATNCYSRMFFGCTSLVKVPELAATTLATSCYDGMFNGCTSLAQAPKRLPSKDAVLQCYEYMFMNCTSLVQAPELPATTLEQSCYRGMFNGCTSLVKVPELPATTLATNCYYNMFNGCTSLKYIKCHAITGASGENMYNWLVDVSPSGIFYKKSGVLYTRGESGIPFNWTIVEF